MVDYLSLGAVGRTQRPTMPYVATYGPSGSPFPVTRSVRGSGAYAAPMSRSGVAIGPVAVLRLVLKLLTLPGSCGPVRFVCLTKGPLNIVRGMRIICDGIHLSDPGVYYLVTRRLSVGARHLDLELRAFRRSTMLEDHSREPVILRLNAEGTNLSGFNTSIWGLVAAPVARVYQAAPVVRVTSEVVVEEQQEKHGWWARVVSVFGGFTC